MLWNKSKNYEELNLFILTYVPLSYRWVPPRRRAIKINVYGVSASDLVSLHNGNNIRVGVVYDNAYRKLKHLVIGVIPELTTLINQPWAIYTLLKSAFSYGYHKTTLETENYEAYKVPHSF